MKRYTYIIALISCLCAGPVQGIAEASRTKLLFEQVGASDFSIAPFTLEIGSGVRSTRADIFVTSGAFDKVLSFLKRASNPLRTPCPAGTLLVTSFEGQKAVATYTIYPYTTPAMILELMRMLPNTPQ